MLVVCYIEKTLFSELWSWLCITGLAYWLIISRQRSTVSLLYGLLLEMCGYSVDVLLLLMLQTCTGKCKLSFPWMRCRLLYPVADFCFPPGYVLCSSLLVALGMPCRSSSARWYAAAFPALYLLWVLEKIQTTQGGLLRNLLMLCLHINSKPRNAAMVREVKLKAKKVG